MRTYCHHRESIKRIAEAVKNSGKRTIPKDMDAQMRRLGIGPYAPASPTAAITESPGKSDGEFVA